MTGTDAYLTITAWPERFSRSQRVDALVRAAGLDPFYAEQRAAKPAPQLVARLSAPGANSAADVLRSLGVGAFVLLQAELNDASVPIRLKRLDPAIGAPTPMYLAEPWRGERFGLVCSDLFLIVRARLIQQHAGAPIVETTTTERGATVTTGITRTTDSSLTDVMDLHLTDGRRLRIDGNKFGFDCLGSARGLSDNTNSDRLSLRLAQEAPKAVVDTSFGSFSVPAGAIKSHRRRSGADGREFRDDHPVFEFYSVWAAAMYRSMLGR